MGWATPVSQFERMQARDARAAYATLRTANWGAGGGRAIPVDICVF